ncbi:hypothetical protein MRX96_039579 [Rhipicephalus microplus]
MDILPSFRQLFAVVVLFGAIHGSSESEGKELVITVPSGKVARRVDDDLNLTCKVASDERFHITWVIPQDKVRQAHRVKIESEHFNEKSVTIYNLEEPDTGWYTCVARHHDSNVNRVFNRTVYVTVSTYALSGRRPCYNQSFVCGNGYCIPKRYACDGHVDCHDSSDEAPKHCGPDPCEDKVLCEDGRCLPRSLCCDPATQPDCRVTYVLPCCKKYLASIANTTATLVGVLARPPTSAVGCQCRVPAVVSVHRGQLRGGLYPGCHGHGSSHLPHTHAPCCHGEPLPFCQRRRRPPLPSLVQASASPSHLNGDELWRRGALRHARTSLEPTSGHSSPSPPEYSPLAQGPPPPYQSTEQLATAGNKEPCAEMPEMTAANSCGALAPGSSTSHPWPCHLWPRDESPPPRFSSLQDLSECEAQCLLPAFEEAVASDNRYDADTAGFHRAPFHDDLALASDREEPHSGSSPDCTLAAGGGSSNGFPEASDSLVVCTPFRDVSFSRGPAFPTRVEDSAISTSQGSSSDSANGHSACQEFVKAEQRAST